MSGILDSPDVLQALQQRKQATGRKLEASRRRIMDTASQFYAPLPKATSRAQHISRFVSNGITIYKGFRIFTTVVTAFRSLFTRRKRRR